MALNKGGEQVVYLSKSQKKIFDFLRRKSSDRNVFPTLTEIQKGARFPTLEETKHALSDLKKVEGIDLFTHVRGEKNRKEPHYFLSPETLEVTVKPVREQNQEGSQRRKPVYSALYIAEPGFGTKAFEEDSILGLRLFLEANGLNKEIQEVIFQGGVIPHIPPYSSKANLTALKFLGWIPRGPDEQRTVSEKMLEEKVDEIDDPYLDHFYSKHVNDGSRRKIRDLADAFKVSGEQVRRLMKCFPESTQLRIQHGEEDKKNIGHIVDATIANWSNTKKERLKEDEKSYHIKIGNLDEGLKEQEILRSIYSNPTLTGELKRKPGEKRQDHLQRVSRTMGDMIQTKSPSDLDELAKEVHKYAFWASERKDYPGLIGAKLKKVEEERLKNISAREELEAKIEELSGALSWTQQLLETNRASITRFTRQYPVNSDEVEVAWSIAKNLYNRGYFNWDVLQQIHPHPSARKMVVVDSGISDLSNGGTIKSEVEYETTTYDGKKVLLVHNLRSIFSDAVTARSIKDAKLEQNVQNMVLQKLLNSSDERSVKTDERPDIILLGGHGAGGFRAMPWFKDSDIIGSSEGSDDPLYNEGQRISYLINLPTMHSMERLDWLVRHGFSNWDTKRFLTGPYASGAVLHFEDQECVDKFLFVGNTDLIKFGKIAREIEVYRLELAQTKNLTKRKDLAKIIKETKDKAKLDFRKVEAAGDFHLGAPDMIGKTSKDQFMRAYQQYQREHGLPQLASWDEMLHGVMDGKFKSGTRYLGLPPEKFRQSVIEKVLADQSLSPEQRAYTIAQKSMENLRAITVHNLADQERLFALLCKPYAYEILKRKGTLVLASGNHANSSTQNSDEAASLASQFEESYRDRGQLQVFSGKGSSVGVGWTDLPETKGRKLFVMHRFPTRQDEGYGVLTHLRNMNNSADVVIAGDRHQPIIFYADGHAGALHPGMEPINTYVPFVGKQAGVRGIVNVLYDPNKKETYGWEMVLNPTLKAIIHKNKIL
jgi:hypothetical protein